MSGNQAVVRDIVEKASRDPEVQRQRGQSIHRHRAAQGQASRVTVPNLQDAAAHGGRSGVSIAPGEDGVRPGRKASQASAPRRWDFTLHDGHRASSLGDNSGEHDIECRSEG